MSGSYRYIAVAFGLILFSALGQANYNASHAQEAEQHAQQSQSESLSPVPVQIIESKAERNARERIQAESKQREIEDLVAQQGMNSATQAINEATQDMRDYALYSTILVGIGTALVFITLILTWLANGSALKAVEVTRSIGESQTRAYVSVSKVSYGSGGNRDGCFFFCIDNGGSTPAKNCSILIGSKTYVSGFTASLGESKQDFLDIDDLFVTQIIDNRENKLPITIEGKIIYHDVFGFEFFSEFKFIADDCSVPIFYKPFSYSGKNYEAKK